MTRLIAVFFGVAVLTACQTMQPPLLPGQLFPGKGGLNVRAPDSPGWKLLDRVSGVNGMAFARIGASPSESYYARVYVIATPGSGGYDELVAFIRESAEKNTSPERFKSIERSYERTEKRGYPCVRVKSTMNDTMAMTPSGQTLLKLQMITLACGFPERPDRGFIMEFSHRGLSLDVTLAMQAEAFFEGVQIPEK